MAPRRPAKPYVHDPLTEALTAWRLWLLGALVGAILAFVIYQIAPPGYRARATVVVDNNLEEAWVFYPDRQLFQFLARETERLEELAWSDAVMEEVSAQTGAEVRELRGGVLELSQPADGGWHFYATDADAGRAESLSSAWAQAFADAARAAVNTSPELEAARAALIAEASSAEPDETQMQELGEDLSQIYERSKGISPFTEVSVSQAENLPVQRSVGLSSYLFVGSLVGALVAPFWLLLRPAPGRR
jgi:hypothetical protein